MQISVFRKFKIRSLPRHNSVTNDLYDMDKSKQRKEFLL